ncbi:unnamed protein product, partial [Adineta steineri]
AVGTDEASTPNIASSAFSMKLKNARTRTGSLIGGDDHSLYTHQEESLPVDLTLVRLDLLRLNFMMESCPLDSLPDPHFSIVFLFWFNSPVISKAAYLVQCANFVRHCSLGQWSEWMRFNMTTFCLHESYAACATENINARLTKLYLAAALSSRLETILDNKQQQLATYNNNNTKETGIGGGGVGATLWNSDETYEDYYNEVVVNRSGHDCSYSLHIIGCLLHCEITSFLRETYDKLPKLSTMSTTNNNFQQKQQSQQRRNNQATSAPPTVVETSSSLTDKR